MSRSGWLGALLAPVLLCGCEEPGLEQLRSDAQSAMERGDATEAERLCSVALVRDEVRGDDVKHWYFTCTHMSALAAMGRGGDVLLLLSQMHDRDGGRVPDAQMYARFSRALVAAGDVKGAAAVVKAGTQRFPARQPDFAALTNEFRWAVWDYDIQVSGRYGSWCTY